MADETGGTASGRVAGQWKWFVIGAVVLIGAATLWLSWFQTGVPVDQLVQQAQAQLAQGHHQQAKDLADKALSRAPDSATALLIAAEATTKLGRYDEALQFYERIPNEGVAESAAGLFGSGELLRHQGHLSSAEERFRHALALNPNYLLAHYRLAFVLGVTGRRWESVPHLLELIKQNRADVPDLLLLGDVERIVDERGHLQFCRRAAPRDPLPLLGLARIALAENRKREATELLKKVVAADPNLTEAQARLGWVLIDASLADASSADASSSDASSSDASSSDASSADAFFEWHEQLPPRVESHPGIWIVCGVWTSNRGQEDVAIRCYLEAVSRDPDVRQANYQLGQLLHSTGKPELAEPFLKRAELLQKLSIVLDGLYFNQNDTVGMEKAAVLTESLSRMWEARAWSQAALTRNPQLGWARQRIARITPALRPDVPRTLAAGNPALQTDLSSYPLPDWSTADSENRPVTPESPTADHVRFNDLAAAAGVQFSYFNGADPATPGARIVETAGPTSISRKAVPGHLTRASVNTATGCFATWARDSLKM